MKILIVLLSSVLSHATAPVIDSTAACQTLLAPHATFALMLPMLGDDDALRVARELYAELFTWLSQKSDVTAQGDGKPGVGDYGPEQTATPSRLLFGRDIVEVDRTAVGLLALKWLLAGDYDRFTSNQAPPVQLSRISFDELASHAREVLRTPADIDAMIVMILTNDLGKVRRYHELTEKAVGRVIMDHDEVLFEGFTRWPEISPSFFRLDAAIRERIVAGLRLGSKLNVGQLAQAENVPANVAAALELAGRPDAFELKFLELLLDVSGARGHQNSAGAMLMIEPVYRSFRLSRLALLKVIEGGSPREAYDEILNFRARLVGQAELTGVGDEREHRALLRLMAMGGNASPEEGARVAGTLKALPADAREVLIRELNVDGIDDGWAILPYYGPATITNAVSSVDTGATEDARRVVFEALARGYALGRAHLNERAAGDHAANGVLTINFENAATWVRKRADGSHPFATKPEALLDEPFRLVARPGEADSFTLRIGK